MSRDHNDSVASSHCPSQDWDRYCDSQDIPEQCPMCGGENADEEGEPICKEAEAFCSTKCRDEYTAEQKKLAESEAQDYFAEQKMLAEHNDKCPRCKGSTQKYCFHETNPDNIQDTRSSLDE